MIPFDSFPVVLVVLLSGLVGSFTHCIGMCGPISAAQSAMRVMNMKPDQMSNFQRLMHSVPITYYCGKLLSYITISAVVYNTLGASEEYIILRYIAAVTLVLIALAMLIGIVGTAPNFKNTATKAASDALTKIGSLLKIKISPFGIPGILMGYVLGFIPCGFSYAVIINISSYSSGIYEAIFATTVFALATTPGLLVVSLGGTAIQKLRIFQYIYMPIILYNIYLILFYAANLVV